MADLRRAIGIYVTLFAVKRLLVVVLLALAVSPITAPFDIQDIVALPGGAASVQAKKAGDDLQPALAGPTTAAIAAPDWRADAPRLTVRLYFVAPHSLPLRI